LICRPDPSAAVPRRRNPFAAAVPKNAVRCDSIAPDATVPAPPNTRIRSPAATGSGELNVVSTAFRPCDAVRSCPVVRFLTRTVVVPDARLYRLERIFVIDVADGAAG
jgi:hypothetical protein